MLNKGKLFLIFSILILTIYPVLALECGDTITENIIMAEDLNCTNATSTLALRVRDGAILDCANYKIIRDDVHQSSVGIWASEGSTIQNCVIQGFKTGITLASQDTNKNNTILNNTIIGTFGVDDWAGISIYNEGAGNNKIINNDISGFSADWWSAGIKIYLYASNNLIERNTLHSNYQGIYLRESQENVITGNKIVSNNNAGIKFDILTGHKPLAINNLIYNNYFESNGAFNVLDINSGNIYNITKTLGTNIIGGDYLGGNYWSDYLGEDLDGDGLGDTSYNPYEVLEDNLPLVLILDSDNDEVPDSEDICPETPESERVNSEGCSCSQIEIPFRDCPETRCEKVNLLNYPEDGFDICESGEIIEEHSCGLISSEYNLGCAMAYDSDNDDVPNEDDLCPNTILPESIPARRLILNHYSDVDGDRVFETRKRLFGAVVDSEYSLSDTFGCSCEQILELKKGRNIGEENFGCTNETIWTVINKKGWAQNLGLFFNPKNIIGKNGKRII